MGANAQTTVPDFVADTVLTAAKLDISAATGVPVFATTVTRDAAFGGANKVLAEGQTCYLESTNVVQFYDGAAWATVGPAAASGFVYLAGAPFGPTGTVSMAASTFTSTYKTYTVILQITAASGDLDVLCRVNVAGTPNAGASAYGWSKGGTFNNAVANDQGSTTTSALINEVRNAGYVSNCTNNITVYDPSNSGTYTTANGTFSGAIDNNGIGAHGYFGFAVQATAANDGLTFVTSTGTITGIYRVYGLSES